MKRALFSPPDSFALSPLLAILPSVGSVGRLEPLTASLFARYEKVTALKKDLAGGRDTNNLNRLSAEEAMVKTVLEWLGQTSRRPTTDGEER